MRPPRRRELPAAISLRFSNHCTCGRGLILSLSPPILFPAPGYEVSDQLHFNWLFKFIVLVQAWNKEMEFQAFLSSYTSLTWNTIFLQRQILCLYFSVIWRGRSPWNSDILWVMVLSYVNDLVVLNFYKTEFTFSSACTTNRDAVLLKREENVRRDSELLGGEGNPQNLAGNDGCPHIPLLQTWGSPENHPYSSTGGPWSRCLCHPCTVTHGCFYRAHAVSCRCFWRLWASFSEMGYDYNHHLTKYLRATLAPSWVDEESCWHLYQ